MVATFRLILLEIDGSSTGHVAKLLKLDNHCRDRYFLLVQYSSSKRRPGNSVGTSFRTFLGLHSGSAISAICIILSSLSINCEIRIVLYRWR